MKSEPNERQEMTVSNHRPRNLLVTGGAGFIGCNFVRHVLDTDPELEVINLDALTYAGSLENLRGVSETHGSRYHKAEFFQRALTSVEMKLKRKSANIAGLQLADLLAHPVRQDILRDAGAIPEKPDTFGTRLVEVVGEKYNRQLYTGRVEGYGKLLFPK